MSRYQSMTAWILKAPAAPAYSYIFPDKESAERKNETLNNRFDLIKVRLHRDAKNTISTQKVN